MSKSVKRIALVSAGALICAPLFAQAQPAAPSPAAASAVTKPLLQADRDYYFNNVAPAVAQNDTEDGQVGAKAKKVQSERPEAKRITGFPPAAKQLAKREALATTKNISPRQSAEAAGEPAVINAKLLTLLVEFNPNANDDFSGWERPDDPSFPTGCETEPAGTLLNGPLHNNLRNPANIGKGTDNNTFWVPNFSSTLYKKMIFSKAGVKQRIRKDLKGGLDIRGRTVRNFYDEMSKGRYQLGGTVSPWLILPHSEAWYSADSCEGGRASDVGHPDNPLGTGQMAIDAVKTLATTNPSFPWADYDQEDQGDLDGDGNLFEPDGAIDHLIVLHAGRDQADNGGAEGSYAEWSSSQVVGSTTGGVAVPEAGGLRVFNFTTQPEDAGIGVVAHEYGHDLGLPDLYDSIGPTDTDVGWWDLMSTGSHSGELFQMMPTHMGAWSKYVLGWVDPKVLDYNGDITKVLLGQGSRPPKGTDAAVRINLPNKKVQVGEPHGGALAWWTSSDQDLADVRLTRSIEVPAGGDVRFWSWNDYTIEELWDYGFIETSIDGGTTWKQEEVFDEAGNMVSTDEDPNGNLSGTFGGLENGLTGDSGGYRHDYVNLTPYAGSTIQLRLRYLTDPAFVERGWFADDFSVTADGTEVFGDDVEGGLNGWTAEDGSLAGTTGAGWVQTSGSLDYEQYYIAEWRNFDGYDNGLRTAYTDVYFVDDEWKVRRTPYNAPGLLVWHRDASHSFNDISNNLLDPPSIGSKGTALLVDAHYEPARRSGKAAAASPSLLDNLGSRQQANDVAFGKVGRYPFTDCVPDGSDDPYGTYCNKFGKRAAVTSFTDAKTWYPGIEYRPDLDEEAPFFFRDSDASTVVPSLDNTMYSTRVVDKDGTVLYRLFGTGLGGGHVLGTGNPTDGRPAIPDEDYGTYADLSLGVKIRILKTGDKNKQAWVNIRPGNKETSPAAIAERVAKAKAEQKALAKKAAAKKADR
jgi:immune inhibitor A